MGYSSDMNNSDVLRKIVRRVPMHIRTKWAERAHFILESGLKPNFADLARFIEQRARVANTVYGQDLGVPKSDKPNHLPKSMQPRPKVMTLNTRGNSVATHVVSRNQSVLGCLLCGNNHSLGRCTQFINKDYDSRRKFLRERRLCDNCLKPGHIARSCMQRSQCSKDGCYIKHHSLMHKPETVKESVGTSTDMTPPPVSQAMNGHCALSGAGRKVALRIIPVKVTSNNSEFVETYALLDQGSDVSLCSRSLCERLHLKGIQKQFTLTTVNNQNIIKNSEEVSLTVSAIDGSESIHIDKLWTVNKLPISADSIPKEDELNSWPHLSDVQLHTVDERDVTLLIGSDTPQAFWVMEHRYGQPHEPYAILSPLGWSVMGPIRHSSDTCKGNVNFQMMSDSLTQEVEKLWTTEFNDMFDCEDSMSVEDKYALKTMEESCKLVDGHYEIAMPWRKGMPCLPNNVALAEARLRHLKRRLDRDVQLLNKYKTTMKDYIDKGYIRKVTDENLIPSSQVWYLPHHPVVNPHKPNKIRVVFDCAARFGNTSLNDQLLCGPSQTNTLLGVLVRWRQERVAIVGDIEAMFHQVRAKQADSEKMRFLWWKDGQTENPPEEYQMLVHIFGAKSSPSCAGYSLRRTAEDNSSKFDKETIDAVDRNFYVDDLLKSVSSDNIAMRLMNQLRELLGLGGFKLTKWMSNSKGVLQNTPPSEKAPTLINLDLDDTDHIERALGVSWNVSDDKLMFSTAHKDKPVTRRGILSTISSLFDPLGLAAPIILPAKMLLQSLCKRGLGWDEDLPDLESQRWMKWLSELQNLKDIAVDRCYKPEGLEVVTTELHHFADASSGGYGAVSYLRYIGQDGRIHCSFVMGKSRLAPKKSVSIPRLELSAAVVAVRLDCLLRKELDLHIDRTLFWTDSTSVLLFIANESRRFQTFVANRVAVIHELSSPEQWRHVASEANPADHASRGLNMEQRNQFIHWLNGPSFLWKDEADWPESVINLSILPENDVELKKNVFINQTSEPSCLSRLFSLCSVWSKLQKTVAWLLRFKQYCIEKYLKKPIATCRGELTVDEFKCATREIIKQVQREAFPDPKIGKKGSLRNLCPMIKDGVLLVGGRLQKAAIEQNQQHPYIIPDKHPVTDMIIRHYHVSSGHSGYAHVLSSIRQRFWIVHGHTAVKRVLSRCFKCRLLNSTPGEQMMAPLPVERLTPDKPPFTFVGVDYFGPMYVKNSHKLVKRYGCLFTCLVSRATHIEISHSLELDSFISALERFMSRRGRPEKVFSDNGTNFTGGNLELRSSLQEWNQKKIEKTLHQREIEWHFNPPSASHMGGIWERMIRTAKTILKSLIGEQTVSDETLSTFMAIVENILNDRPLTPPSSDCRDLAPLTPNKLLLLRETTSLPLGVFDKTDCYCKRWWRQAQYLADVFWRRWIKEYLPTLQTRQKWLVPRRNIQVGDIVLIVEPNVPRGQWPIGVVVDIHKSSDGYVRSAEVRTATTTKIRPITKLCFLEGDFKGDTKANTKQDHPQVNEQQDNTTQLPNVVRARPKRNIVKPNKLVDYVLE